MAVVVFQDFFSPVQRRPLPGCDEGSDDDDGNNEISNVFFELANAPVIGYRFPPAVSADDEDTTMLVIRQDIGACQRHTGGIVWETSFLLLEFLLRSNAIETNLGRAIEVGAGCGLLGQVLHGSNLTELTVVTEADPVLVNLKSNVECNRKMLRSRRRKGDDDLHCCSLDWLNYRRDMDAQPSIFSQPFDTLLGTDVVFSPVLVEPLLWTLSALSHGGTVAYLCLQVRCTTSHRMLLDAAKSHHWEIEDITTSQLASVPSCWWGFELECHLLRMTRIKE